MKYGQTLQWSDVVVLVELPHTGVQYADSVRSLLNAVAPDTVLHVVHGTYFKIMHNNDSLRRPACL